MERPNAKRIAAACVCLLAAPVAAAAQQDAAAQVNQGPMKIERVENGFAITPEFKVTDVDKSHARLAGASGGWVFDRTIVVGGAGYWLTNNSSAFKMAYGGAVVEWLVNVDAPIGFSVRTLVGGGRATLANSSTEILPFDHDGDGRVPGEKPLPTPS